MLERARETIADFTGRSTVTIEQFTFNKIYVRRHRVPIVIAKHSPINACLVRALVMASCAYYSHFIDVAGFGHNLEFFLRAIRD